MRRWSGIIAMENVWSTDDRRVQSWRWLNRDLPLPLLWLPPIGPNQRLGHEGGQHVGTIDTLSKFGSIILATGRISNDDAIMALQKARWWLEADADQMVYRKTDSFVDAESARIRAAHIGQRPVWPEAGIWLDRLGT